MEFDFVVGRYRKGAKAETFLAGFNSLIDAKEFAEYTSGNYLTNGFMFIDTPKGMHILGEHDHYSAKSQWYEPDNIQKAIIYDARKDRNIDLDAYLPIRDFYRFTKGVSLLEQRKADSPNSLLDKLSDHKKSIESGNIAGKGINHSMKSEKYHEEGLR